MDVRQIEYFLRIAELGSINKAAADLRIAQPSLSRWVSQLEQEIGATLFVRTRSGVRVTDAGQMLADRARPLLRELQVLQADVGKRASSQFNLALPFAFQSLVAAPFAEHILRSAPETTLRVYEGINNSIRLWMESGTVDAAVMVSLENAPDTFSMTPLLQEQLMLIGPRDDRLRIDTPVSLAIVGASRIILPGRPNVISVYIENSLRRAGERYQNVFEAETLSLCLELTGRGLGRTVMPYSAVHGSLGSRTDLSAAPVANLGITWNLHINRRRTYAASTRTVIQLLSTHIATAIASKEWKFAKSLLKRSVIQSLGD